MYLIIWYIHTVIERIKIPKRGVYWDNLKFSRNLKLLLSSFHPLSLIVTCVVINSENRIRGLAYTLPPPFQIISYSNFLDILFLFCI